MGLVKLSLEQGMILRSLDTVDHRSTMNRMRKIRKESGQWTTDYHQVLTTSSCDVHKFFIKYEIQKVVLVIWSILCLSLPRFLRSR